MVTGTDFPGFETTVVSGLSAAVLQALGCPIAAKGGGDLLVPEDFVRWRVAVLGGGAALGAGNVVHMRACRRGGELRPIVLPDIALLPSRQCPCCETAQVALAVPGVSAPAVERWLYDVDNALLTDPPEDGEAADVLAQLRLLRLRDGLDGVMGRFADGVALPVPLHEAVEGCRAWMTGRAEVAAAALREDGMPRLLAHLQTLYSTPDIGVGRACWPGAARAFREAVCAVPAALGAYVVCMFAVSNVVVDAAVALAPHSAVGEQGPGMQRKAVAVLPRLVAVYVAADFAVNHADLPPAPVFTAPVRAAEPALSAMCAVALEAWDHGGLEPRTAWTAAMSACA